MALTSMQAFIRGRLFANNSKAFTQIAIGVGVTTLLFLAAHKLGLPAWGAAAITGLVGGGLQPFLFKDLKYR